MNDKQVSVIIPIYNAFKDTLECIESVLRHSSESIRILAIDDKSPDGSFEDYFKKNFIEKGKTYPKNLILLRNDVNLGFVGTCNRGMILESGEEDIILLNSDTVVTKNWAKKLQAAAYSSMGIGTVTPFTNNGTICSIPSFLQDNNLPSEMSLDEYAELVETVSRREYPIIPTCVGFCTYIKREALNKVGFFDPVFGKGYGEENDLSLRIKAQGYVDILDDATFIHHKGSLSFGTMKEALSKNNTEIINERYPDFFTDVSKFCMRNPLHKAQGRVQNALVALHEKKRPIRILHILHNGPFQEYNHGLGGTELHVRELIKGLPEFSHWSLVVKLDKPKNCYILSAHLHDFTKTIVIPISGGWLENIIRPEFFDYVHVHHSLHFDRKELADMCSKHPGLIASVHDYYSLCPRIYMRTRQNNVCEGTGCENCDLKGDDLTAFRSQSEKIFQHARKVVSFSNSSKTILNKVFGSDLNIEVIPHGISSVIEPSNKPLHDYTNDKTEPAKVAFLSPIVFHKGEDLIVQSSRCESLPGGRHIEWHLWSSDDRSKLTEDSKLIMHGRYEKETLYRDLKEFGIDLIIIPSCCNETFSFTLTEAWNAGLPVIVTPYGALKERVEETQAGWVLKDETPEALFNLLSDIFTASPADYKSKQERALAMKVKDLSSEVAHYKTIYSGAPGHTHDILAHIQPDLISAPEEQVENVQPSNQGFSRRVKEFIVESAKW